MGKKYQIFVSSTYKDLKDERLMAINTIMHLGHIPAGMEMFSATGSTQLETIKPIICESDYYLIIIGGKYGTVNKDLGLSYTELEYDFAIKNNKRIIAFVHDNPENLPYDLRENTDRLKKKFERFRNKILKDKMVKMWHDKADLSQSIATSISVVINQYPSKTCWIHVNQDDIYTPIEVFEEPQNTLNILPEILTNVGVYFHDVAPNSLTYKYTGMDVHLNINMNAKQSIKYLDEYAGCYMRLDKNSANWYQYVLKDFFLHFHYKIKTPLLCVWVEIKNQNAELLKQKITLTETEGDVYVELNNFVGEIEEWRKVKEVCFVFRPLDCSFTNTLKVTSFELIRKRVEN